MKVNVMKVRVPGLRIRLTCVLARKNCVEESC